MASSLTNLADKLAEGIHKIKYKDGHDTRFFIRKHIPGN